jgi:hypothetical protein
MEASDSDSNKTVLSQEKVDSSDNIENTSVALESLCPSTLSSILRRLSESSEDKVNIDTACDP